MLNPFRIRNLYFNASDLVDCSGVVQLSPQQYDQEIQTTPEALFAYLDEDDGETVTVGSSFELKQRLLEPPGRFSSWHGHLATDDPPPLHVFDIQRSTRATEAWRKYAINYTQPSAPTHTQQSVPRLENRKHDDYQYLLARFQVLELEVKLLKEAFKMHTVTTAVQSHQTQRRSVFANACKNSDLFAQSPPCNVQPISPISEQELHGRHESQSLGNLAPNWWKQSELQASQHGNIGEAAVPRQHRNKAANILVIDTEIDDLLDSFRLEHPTTLPPGYRSRNWDASDQTAQDNPQHCWHSTMHDCLEELPKAPKSVPESLSSELGHFNKPETRIKELLAEDSAVRPPGDELSSISSLRQKPEDIETRTISSPAATSEQGTLKSLLDLEPEAEIARFPTIFQLEKEGLRSTNGKSVSPHDPSSSTTPLTRAKTVTSSNPAARLLKPFDPATEVLGVSTSQNSLPRRSGSERYRRRPYAEDFSGTGRTLWEEFERPGPQAQSTAPRNFSRPEPRPLHVVPPQPNSSITRSQSLNHDHPSGHSQSHRLAPMRSALDLSRTQRNHGETVTSDQLRHARAAVSTRNLVRRSTIDPKHQRSKQIESCIQTLQEMGYKPHSRLPVYAGACNGDLSKAMVMAEEDEKATQETRKVTEATGKVLNCVQQLKEMGYGAQHPDEELKKFARDAAGDAAAAVEAMEVPTRREMEEWRVRELHDRQQRGMQGQAMGEGMPGSFP